MPRVIALLQHPSAHPASQLLLFCADGSRTSRSEVVHVRASCKSLNPAYCRAPITVGQAALSVLPRGLYCSTGFRIDMCGDFEDAARLGGLVPAVEEQSKPKLSQSATELCLPTQTSHGQAVAACSARHGAAAVVAAGARPGSNATRRHMGGRAIIIITVPQRVLQPLTNTGTQYI